MPIDRKAAVDYAKKFWNRVADDDKYAISSGLVRLADKRKSMAAPASEGWEAFSSQMAPERRRPYSGGR